MNDEDDDDDEDHYWVAIRWHSIHRESKYNQTDLLDQLWSIKDELFWTLEIWIERILYSYFCYYKLLFFTLNDRHHYWPSLSFAWSPCFLKHKKNVSMRSKTITMSIIMRHRFDFKNDQLHHHYVSSSILEHLFFFTKKIEFIMAIRIGFRINTYRR